ncbi:S-adenosyl-L-methionine-dependent methyltransferase [Lipomyces chichibuensis]|uniref:S-adenosyl-L-methionine-dependent methyltransferase n=1 Tax=Lipomyces chichibuensis TaxID=1546026 RepID=UPI0033435B15
MPVVAIQTLDRRQVKACKTALEKSGHFDKLRGIEKDGNGFLIFTNKTGDYVDLKTIAITEFPELVDLKPSLEIMVVPDDKHKTVLDVRPSSNLKSAVRSVLESLIIPSLSTERLDQIIKRLPQRYYIYGQFLLLSSSSFESIPEWQSLAQDDLAFANKFYQLLVDRLKVTHIAQNAPIPDDDDNAMRKPTHLVCLYGDFGLDVSHASILAPSREHIARELWAATRQNNICQTWAPRYTMFSRGNIKEKARVLQFENVESKTVVDLYAGIGYFAFSYAKCGADLVLCWEINPWSVEGLLRGAKANKWNAQLVQHDEDWVIESKKDSAPKLVVFLEDNRYAISRIRTAEEAHDLKYNISHINMGLLPSSEQSWPIATELAVLSSEDNVALHVHSNVAHSDIDRWSRNTGLKLLHLISEFNPGSCVMPTHIEKIKSFAPGVMHICGDFLVKKM